jgi:hypothetical protein
MKNKFQPRFLALAIGLSTLNSQLSTAHAQGALTPPGAPAPTMKSLDQIYARVDARNPITNASSAVTISVSGSYYLTTNLTVSAGDAITIATSDVMLDLNGWTIKSTAASAAGSAISINSGLRNLTIEHGFIESGVTNNGSGVFSGSGFNYGISYSPTAPANIHVSGVSVAGCMYSGIYLSIGNSTLVEACTVRTMGSYGIFASTVKSCVVLDCGNNAIFCDQVSDSRGNSTGNGYGIYTATAQNCFGTSSSSYGIYASLSANNCAGYSVTGIGLFAPNASYCTGNRSGGTAIQATMATGCLALNGTNIVTYKYNMP